MSSFDDSIIQEVRGLLGSDDDTDMLDAVRQAMDTPDVQVASRAKKAKPEEIGAYRETVRTRQAQQREGMNPLQSLIERFRQPAIPDDETLATGMAEEQLFPQGVARAGTEGLTGYTPSTPRTGGEELNAQVGGFLKGATAGTVTGLSSIMQTLGQAATEKVAGGKSQFWRDWGTVTDEASRRGQPEKGAGASNALGQLASFLLTDKGLGKAATLVNTGIVGYGSGATDYRQTVMADGGDPDPLKQLGVGLVYAAIEAGTERMGLDALNRIGSGKALQISKSLFDGNFKLAAREMILASGGALTEGAEEAVAQFLQNATAKLTFDPERDLLDGVSESAALGAFAGGVAGAGLRAARGMQARQVQGARQQRDAGRTVMREQRVVRERADEVALTERETFGQRMIREASTPEDRSSARMYRAQELQVERERANRQLEDEIANLETFQAMQEADETQPGPEPEKPAEPTVTTEVGTPKVLERRQAKDEGWQMDTMFGASGNFNEVYPLVEEANADEKDANTYAVVKMAGDTFGVVSKPKTQPQASETAAPIPVETPNVQEGQQEGRQEGLLTEQASPQTDEEYRAFWEQKQKTRSQSPDLTVQLVSGTGDKDADRIVDAIRRRGGRAVVVRSSKSPAVEGQAFRDGTIVIDLAAGRPVEKLVGHEVVHRLQHADESNDAEAREIRGEIAGLFQEGEIEAATQEYEADRAAQGQAPLDQKARRREGEAVMFERLLQGPGKGDLVDRLIADRVVRQTGLVNRVKVFVGNTMNKLGLLNKDKRKRVLDILDKWETYSKNRGLEPANRGSDEAILRRMNGPPQEVDISKALHEHTYGSWITPDGKIHAVPPQAHWEAAEKLAEQYGFAKDERGETTTEDQWRRPAIDAGLVRVVRSSKKRLTMQARRLTPETQRVVLQMAQQHAEQGGEVLIDVIDAAGTRTAMIFPTTTKGEIARKIRGLSEPAGDEAVPSRPVDPKDLIIGDIRKARSALDALRRKGDKFPEVRGWVSPKGEGVWWDAIAYLHRQVYGHASDLLGTENLRPMVMHRGFEPYVDSESLDYMPGDIRDRINRANESSNTPASAASADFGADFVKWFEEGIDEAIAQTKTPEFKAWFGDSKVVDKRGNPLVVFRGDRTSIRQFDGPNVFATDHMSVAAFYGGRDSKSMRSVADRNESDGLYRVYMSLQNPLVLNAKRRSWLDIPMGDRTMSTDTVADEARRLGHDGVILRNVLDQTGAVQTEYIAFKPNQIKSAIGNRGTFSRTSASIDEAIAQTKTPEFKAWFGDWEDPLAFSSKRDPGKPAVSMAVARVNGELRPMVLYHGTRKAFSAFERRPGKNTGLMGIPYDTVRSGFFFARNPDMASTYANSGMDVYRGVVAPDANIKPVYLNIKSPFRFSSLDEDLYAELEAQGINRKWLHFLSTEWEYFDDEDGERFVKALKAIGYDGAVILEDDPDTKEPQEVWVAFDASQIKSATGNRGTFSKDSNYIDEALRKGPLDTTAYRTGVKSEKLDTVEDIAKWMDAKYVKANGARGEWDDPVAYKRAKGQLKKEIEHELSVNPDARGWYSADFQKAYEETKRVIPELREDRPDYETKRSLFTAVAAIWSPGNEPSPNWEVAAHSYREWLRTGKFGSIHPHTGLMLQQKNPESAAKQLRTIEHLVATLGEAGAVKFLRDDRHDYLTLQKFRQNLGTLSKNSSVERLPADLRPADGRVPGMFMFGPKVGQFFLNGEGLPGVTVDKWATRTGSRLFGRLHDPMEGPGSHDAPSPSERGVISRLFTEVGKELGLKPEEAQALGWTYEQGLYTVLGVTSKSGSFAAGGKEFADAEEARLGQGARRDGEVEGDEAIRSREARTEEVLSAVRANPYGFSYDPDLGRTKLTGPQGDFGPDQYIVSIVGAEKQFSSPDVVDRKDVDAWVKSHAAGLRSDQYIGGWTDSNSGKFFLDVSDEVSGLDQAMKLGRERNQLAIFHPFSETVIPVTPDPAATAEQKFEADLNEALAHPEDAANQALVKAASWAAGKVGGHLARINAGIAANLAGTPTGNVLEGAREIGRKAGFELVPDHLLPAEWVAARREAQMASRYGKAQAAAYGTLLHKGGTSSVLGFEVPKKWAAVPANRRLMGEVLLGTRPITDLPAEIRPIARGVRDDLDRLGQAAVNAGLLSQETFDRNKGKYLPRLYQPKELEARGLMGAVNRLRRNGERFKPRLSDTWAIVDSNGNPINNPVNNTFRHNSSLDRDQFLDALIAVNTVQEVNRSIRGSGQSITTADLAPAAMANLSQPLQALVKQTRSSVAGRYTKSDPIDQATLDRMGLIREPAYPVAKAMMQLRHDIALTRFFSKVAADPKLASPTETTMFDSQVPSSPKFGSLAGMWLPAELHKDLENLTYAPSVAGEFYDAALSMWKFGKTILNPATWGRNLMGNTMFADLAGINPLDPRTWKHYAEGFQMLRGKRGTQVLQDMQRHGVIGGEFTTAELGNILDQIGVPLTPTTNPVQWAVRAIGTSLQGLAKGYNSLDLIFKAASYAQQRAAGVSPKDAANYVRKWFPSYDQVPNTSTIRGIKRTVMPFASFFYESLRIGSHAVREKPVTAAKWMASGYLLTQLSMMMLGLGDKDREEVEKQLRGQVGGVPLFSILLPFRDAKGRLIQWDLTNILPYANLLGTRVDRGRSGYPLRDFYESFFGSLVFGNPFVNAAVGLAMNEDPFFNRPLVHKGMTRGEAGAAVGGFLANKMQPGFVSAAQTLMKTRTTEPSTLSKRDTTTTALRAVAGVDVRSADPQIGRMIDEYIEANNLPLQAEYGGDTTPRQRSSRLLYQAILDQDVEAFRSARDQLGRLGVPVKNAKQLRQVVESRHPLQKLREEDRQKFLRTRTAEQRRVVEAATREHRGLLPKALRLLSAARTP